MSKIDYSKWNKFGDDDASDEEKPSMERKIVPVRKKKIQRSRMDTLGLKSERNRFRLYFKPDPTGRTREIYVDAEEFALTNDRFDAIYNGMGRLLDGSLLIGDENGADFEDYLRHGLNDRDAVEPVNLDKHGMMFGDDTISRLLPIAHRWSALNTTGYLHSLHSAIVYPGRLVSLPLAIQYLRSLCNVLKADDGQVRYSAYPHLKHIECSIGTQLRHRITELVMYLAEFKTSALQAAGVDKMEELSDNLKTALFYLAEQIDHAEKTDDVVDRFLQMLNGNTERPKMAPDQFSAMMCQFLSE